MSVTYPLRLMFDCSTAHLSPASRAYLTDAATTGKDLVAATPYGWFVWAANDPDDGVPADLAALMANARELDADYILFDCDAAVSDALPTFAWSP